jgi:predicted Na+-dependent transporter
MVTEKTYNKYLSRKFILTIIAMLVIMVVAIWDHDELPTIVASISGLVGLYTLGQGIADSKPKNEAAS